MKPLSAQELEWYAHRLGGEVLSNGTIACAGPGCEMLIYFDRSLTGGCSIACPPDAWQSCHDFIAEVMFERTAYEARTASHNYWALGGFADRKYPVAPDMDRIWPLGGRAETAQSSKGWIKRGPGK